MRWWWWMAALAAGGPAALPVRADPLTQAAVELGSATGRRDLEIAVSRGAGPVEVRAFGRPVDATVSTGSARKWLTAALILTLVDERRMTLDDPVAWHLPAWDLPGRRRITVRMLLSHTSGLPPRPPPGGCSGQGTLEACVDRMAGLRLLDPPGAAFRYSTAGFNVAARVAELVGRAPYRELLIERLLEPLGMRDTSLRRAGPGLSEMVGEVWTTPRDFHKFVRMVLDRGVSGGRRVLSEAAVAEMEAGQTGAAPNHGGVPKRTWWEPGHDYYGLGMWRNAADPDGRLSIASAEGRGGFVAWIDRARGVAGVASVHDHDPAWLEPSPPSVVQVVGELGDALLAPASVTSVDLGERGIAAR
ncbi:MAG: serine hydrolase domain-containing protein [Myxococcota bacterium]